ncbi:MAG: PAS-domain containing protein [Rhodospirillaceae bacterium]|nr:PAS-domain containing protein [Rhodospirillaceae bacterium]
MSERVAESGDAAAIPGATARLWERLFPIPPVPPAVLLAHQRRTLRLQVPILLAVIFVAATLVGIVFWNVVPKAHTIGWVGALWLYCTFGAWRELARRHVPNPRPPTLRFVRRSIVSNLIPGLIWGAAATLFFVPDRFDLQVFLVFILGGLSAGMVAAAPSMPAAALAFVLPTTLPLCVEMFRRDTQPSTVIGIMIAIYVAALLLMLRNGYRSFCDGVVAEERAKQAEEVLRDSIEALDDGYVLFGPDHRVILHNRRYLDHFTHFGPGEAIVGRSFEELVRSGIEADFFAEDDILRADPEEGLAARSADFLRAGKVQSERRLADGRRLLISTHPMPGGRRVAIVNDITAIKRAEQRLFAAIEAMDDGFILYGPDERVLLHNRRYLEQYSYLRDKLPLIGQQRVDLLRYAAAADAFRGVAEAGGPESWVQAQLEFVQEASATEFERETSDGRIYLVRTQITGEGGRVAITTDVTALKHAQQRLIAAIEAMDDGFMLCGPDERVVLHNRHYVEHFPSLKKLGSLVGRTRQDLLLHIARNGDVAADDGLDTPGATEAWAAAEAKRMRGSGPHEFERQTGDGRTLLVRVHPAGKDGSVAITTDLTALKRAERRLVDAVESMSEAFVLWDSDDRLVLCNDAYARMFEGIPRASERGGRFEDILRAGVAAGAFPEAAGREEEYVRQRLASRHEPAEPVVHAYRGGRWLRLAERRTSEGGIVGVRSDVTETIQREQALRDNQRELAERVRELEEMQRQLQDQRDGQRTLMRQVLQARDEAAAANAAKSVFLANMSHELRTPLNAIIGFAEIMNGELFGALGHPRYAGYIGDMLGAAKHLLKLINDILDLSKIEAGKWELREEPVDVRRTLEGVMRLFRAREEAQRLDIAVDAPEAMPPILADERALKQILINAMSNAIKFTPAGGRVRLRARRDGRGRLHLAIGDSGVGIKPEEMTKALSPFGQIDNHMTRRHQGTGLGLPIAKALVEHHGGRLRIRSRPGFGTVIAIVLPSERFLGAQQGFVAAAE